MTRPSDDGQDRASEQGAATVTPLRPKRGCPECGRSSARDSYPFCSPRCKAIDLNRWLSGSYVIPASEEEPSDPADNTAD